MGSLITAALTGLVVGLLGRLIAGRRRYIPLWLTVVVGIVASFVGTFVGNALGLGHSAGIDYAVLLVQIGLAAIAVAVVSRVYAASPVPAGVADPYCRYCRGSGIGYHNPKFSTTTPCSCVGRPR